MQHAQRTERELVGVVPLRGRGWTPTLIKRFLDPPDATRRNPYYRSAAPMRLYDLNRVEEIEATDEWMAAVALAEAHSQSGKKGAARKAAELLARVETLPITVRLLPLEEVRRRAIASYNFRKAERSWDDDYEPASEGSDPAFLERISVNFVRHELTAYDTRLEEVAGKTGVSAAQTAIRRRVYAEIARVYPQYAQECQRQVAYRALLVVL